MGKKKGIINAIFLVSVFAVTVYLVFRGQDIKEIMQYIKSADVRYWIVAGICVLLFIAGEAVNISYMLHTIGQRVHFLRCLLYSFVGFFFANITPTSTGGQPAQVYYMRKDKIPTPISTLVLMIVTITYKLVLVVVGLAVLIIRPAKIMEYLEPVMGLCYLGIFLNVVTISFIMLLIFHPTMARNIVVGCTTFLAKLRIARKPKRFIEKVDTAMVQYRDVASYFRKNKFVVWNVFLITMVQRFMLFNVTYLTFRSFGFHGTGFVTITVMQAMVSVAVDMLPFPGGMGISEKLVLTIFAPLSGGLALPIMLVSRVLSYYTQLIVSALMTIVAHFGIGRRSEKIEG